MGRIVYTFILCLICINFAHSFGPGRVKAPTFSTQIVMSSFQRRDGGGSRGGYSNPRFGGGGGGGGGRGRFNSQQDPSEKLRFSKTIKIDPEKTTALSEMSLSAKTRSVLEGRGFTVMTPVQSQSYEYVFSGADVVARSRTGTGKTFAFGLPLIEKIVASGLNEKRGSGLPLILVLEPTRELALQVAQELGSICAVHRMRVMAMFGGASFSVQERALRAGVHIVVTTPGRLLDHITRGTIDLGCVEHVVLDEGDTMLEMGFQKDVESIVANVKAPGEASRRAAAASLESQDLFDSFDDDNDYDDDTFAQGSSASGSDRSVQMLLFSATMPGWICKLTDKHMHAPVFLDAVQEGETRLASTIKHLAIKLPYRDDRLSAVTEFIEDIILTRGTGGQTIIFTNKKEDADILSGTDCFGKIKTQVLHGDISQATRQTTIKQFRDGQVEVLIATDVAARGLDIAGVDLVIHVSLPMDHDTYVHRSGRTGRAGRNGTSVMFFTPSEERKLQVIENTLNFRFERMGLPTAEQISEASAIVASKKLEKVGTGAVNYFRPYAKSIIENLSSLSSPRSVIETPSFDLDFEDDEDDDSIPSDVESDDEADGRGNVEPVSMTIEVNGESKVVYSAEVVETLFARCLAAITNRNMIRSRSLITGENDLVTLQVDAAFKNGTTPMNVRDWQKLIAGVLRRSLGFENLYLGKVSMARGKNKLFAVMDMPVEEAQKILEALETVRLPPGIEIQACTELPQLVVERNEFGSRSSYGDSRGGSGGGGGGGGGYRGGGRGGSNDGSSRRYSGGGGGYAGSGGSSGGSRGSWGRDGAGAGGGRSDSGERRSYTPKSYEDRPARTYESRRP